MNHTASSPELAGVGKANPGRPETASNIQNLSKFFIPSGAALNSDTEIQRLRTHFGEAQLAWKSSRDPEIPKCLQEDPRTIDRQVLTVRCGSGLAALVANSEGVHQLLERNPELRQGLVSSWDHGFIFWTRVNSVVANGEALSKKGIELMQSGIIPVGCDPTNFRTWIHINERPLAFESLDLKFTIESEAAPKGIPIQIASRLRTLFGETPCQLVSSLDAAIPSDLKPVGSGHQSNSVIAIQCGNGLGVMISKPECLGKVEQSYSVLRQAILTQWQGHYIHWVRFDPEEVEKCFSNADHSERLGAGAFFVSAGLIPVATADPDAELQVVREGTLQQVNFAQAAKENAGRKQDEDAQSRESSAASGQLLNELQAVFGKESVFGNVHANDPRIPAGLVTDEEIKFESAGSEILAVQCGPHAKGHLVAVVIHRDNAWRTFSLKNPKSCCLATGWGTSAVVWLRLAGSVPRNLRAGSVTWIAQGMVPISVRERDLIRFRQPDSRIPVIKFEEIQWEADVAQAFAADKIEESHGSPFLPVKPREFRLNPDFLAEVLLEQLDVAYDRAEECFRRFDVTSAIWATISSSAILRLVANKLIQLSHDFPSRFPPTEISKSVVRNIVWLMEVKSDVRIPTGARAVLLRSGRGVCRTAAYRGGFLSWAHQFLSL